MSPVLLLPPESPRRCTGAKSPNLAVKKKIAPALDSLGLKWVDVEPALAILDDIEELKNAITDPNTFMEKLWKESQGPAAKIIVMAVLRVALSP